MQPYDQLSIAVLYSIPCAPAHARPGLRCPVIDQSCLIKLTHPGERLSAATGIPFSDTCTSHSGHGVLLGALSRDPQRCTP